MRSAVLGIAGLTALGVACGPATVRPTSYADPDVTCPAGRSAWSIEIKDERAEPKGSEKMVAAIRDGIQKSFPGCRWSNAAPGADTITIEVHRFASHLDDEYTSWEAAVEWTVRAQDAGGRTLTEFQADEALARPNYRGSDNEKESLTEVYQKALSRTIKGLQALPASTSRRLTPEQPLDSLPQEGS
jgi:hypothetical protein